jgi:hypothetical protein
LGELRKADYALLFNALRCYWRGNLLIQVSDNGSLPWSVELIDRFVHHWNWPLLFKNKAISWSPELIERFENHIPMHWISENELLPWSIELIERFETRLNWESLSRKEYLPWSLELIERFESRWQWMALTVNEALPWSLELILKYENRWFWPDLIRNPAIPWSPQLIERFAEHWRISKTSRGDKSLPDHMLIDLTSNLARILSDKPDLPCYLNWIERRSDWRWYWIKSDDGAFLSNESLKWTHELIECFADGWRWTALSKNEALPWTRELIERYEGRWNWSYQRAPRGSTVNPITI